MIDNTQDTIDSREIIERIEELSEREEEGGLSPEEFDEIAALREFAAEVVPYCPDWVHGVTLIRETYFTEYAEELADEVYNLPTTWPCNCIDWEKATLELQQDYTEADFGDVTYYFR